MAQHDEDVSFYKLFTPLTIKKIVVFIVLIGYAVFFNALFGSFVWDDLPFVILNPAIHSVDIVQAFGNNSHNANGYYRPLQPLYFSVLYALFKETPFFYHLIQISMHIGLSVLLFFVFRKFFTLAIAFVLALIFMIHPMQVESVSYIAASGYQLFFLFGVSALLFSLKKVLKKTDYPSIGVLLLLTILARETGILFFVVILFLQFLYYKKRILWIFLTEIAAVVVYALIRFGLSGASFEKDSFYPIAQLTFWERLLNIPQIVFYYIKTLVFPVNLAIDQHWVISSVRLETFYFPLLISGVVFFFYAFAVYRIFQKDKNAFKIVLVFSLWAFTGFAMLMQIVPLDMTVAERWVYFPIVGVLGILGVIYQTFKIRNKTLSTYIVWGVICLLIFFSIRTIVRNANWQNPYTLYSHDLQVEKNYDLENMLGTELANQKRYKEALPHLLNAHKLRLHDSNIYNIGLVYESLGQQDKAKYYYELVIEGRKMLVRDEVKISAYMALGRLLIFDDDIKKSRDFYKNAVTKYPTQATFWSYLAITEYKLQNKTEALLAAEKAKALLPNNSTKLLYQRIKNDEPLKLREE